MADSLAEWNSTPGKVGKGPRVWSLKVWTSGICELVEVKIPKHKPIFVGGFKSRKTLQ